MDIKNVWGDENMFPYYTPRPFPYNNGSILPYPSMLSSTYSNYPMTSNLYDLNNYRNNIIPSPPRSLSTDKDLSKHYLSVGRLNSISNTNRSATHPEHEERVTTFRKLVESHTTGALDLLNDENLPFYTLFQLRDDIKERALFEGLSLRNKTALILAEDILSRKVEKRSIEFSSCDYIQSVHSALKWIVETGSIHDGLSSDHDTVVDVAAAFLLKLFHEKSILPTMTDMMFQRNRKGLLTHDLVWAFFEARDPQSLILIANRLKSEHDKDVEFARKLLSFVPGVHKSRHTDMNQQYSYITNWLHDNRSFLQYTGESPQQLNSPIPYVVVLEAKYLCKTLSTDTGKVLESLTNKDYHLIDRFNTLDMNHKILLSDFSFSLHQKNLSGWKMWLQYPITEQINMAKARIGGEL